MFSGIFGGWGQPSANETATRADYALLQQVRAYWQALREGDALPMRSRIDPRGIEGALEHTFLIERVAPGVARFRLAGMHFTDLMGMDVRGMPVSAMVDPASRLQLADVLEQAFGLPGVADLSLQADRGPGRPALEGRMLVLPVRGERAVPLAVGCLVGTGSIGRAPRRFCLSRAVVETLTMPGMVPETGLAAASLARPPRAVPGRAHLRLVKSA